jgi:hypothetical protein
LFQEERIWDIMGDGGQVSGWMEGAEEEEKMEEEEEEEEEREKDKEVVEEEEVDEVGLWQREGGEGVNALLWFLLCLCRD